MPDKSLEQQMQEMLSGLEFKPDDKVWEVIRTEIREEKKRRFAFWWWLLPVFLGAAIVTGLFLHNTGSNKNNTVVIAPATAPGDKETVTPKQNADKAITGDQTNATNVPTPQKNEQGVPATTNIIANNTQTPGAVAAKQSINNYSAPVQKDIPVQQEEQVVAKETTGNNTAKQTNPPTDKTQQTAEAKSSLQGSGSTVIAATTAETKTTKDPAVKEEGSGDKKENADKTVTQKEVKKADSAVAAPQVITTKAGNKKWKFSAVADVSAAKLSKAIISGFGADKVQANYNNPSSGAGSGGQWQNYAANYSQQTPFKGYELSLGVQAEKPLNNRWSFITGLQYQYTHYTSRMYAYRDSFTYLANSASFANSGRLASSGGNVNYSIHALSVPLFLQYKIVTPVYVYAGLENGFVVSARRSEYKVDYNTQQQSSSSASAKSATYTYQPAFSFGLNVAMYDGKNYTWFVAPHVDYGISKTFRESMEKNNALRYGLQLSVQMKNKKGK